MSATNITSNVTWGDVGSQNEGKVISATLDKDLLSWVYTYVEGKGWQWVQEDLTQYPQGKRTSQVFIDSGLAKELLEKYNEGNRSLKKWKPQKFSRIIKNNEWRCGVETPILFSKNRRILNGQGRLSGIVESGVGIWVLATFGCTDLDLWAVDTGMEVRSSRDLSILMGWDFAESKKQIAKIIEIANYMHNIRNKRSSSITPKELYQFCSSNRLPLQIVSGTIKQPVLRNSPVLAALTSAFYDVAPNQTEMGIERFKMICRSIEEGPNDSCESYTNHIDNPLWHLREILMKSVGHTQSRLARKIGSGDGAKRSMVYDLVETAIKKFLNGENVKRLLNTKKQGLKFTNVPGLD